MHAALTALLACYYVFYAQDLNMWDDFSTRHRGWEQVVCCSLGYFVFDLIQISVVKPTPSDYYESAFHHIINLYVHFVPVCIYHGYVQLSMVGCKSSVPGGRACATAATQTMRRYGQLVQLPGPC